MAFSFFLGQMGEKKTANKSAPQLIPRPDGKGALLSGGVPGNKGGGRPTKAFKEFLADLRKDPNAQAALEKAALDPTGRNFGPAWKIAADYDDDKPAEKHSIVGPVEVRVRFEREGRRITAS